MSGDIAARYLVEDDRCYMHADGSYLGKYQGKLNLILSHEGPKLHHYYFEKGTHILYENDETPYFKRAECKTNSSSSSAAANSGLFNKFFPYNKRFVLTHTPEGQVNYAETNSKNVVNLESQQQSGTSSAAGKRKTRKRKMRTRRYTSKRR